MTLDLHDNPNLTAYALGELDGDDARAVESLLARDEAARRYVDDVRRTAGLITDSLRTEPVRGPATVDHRAIDAAYRRAGQRKSRLRFWVPTGLAAALAVMAGAWMVMPGSRSREVVVADGWHSTEMSRVSTVNGDESAKQFVGSGAVTLGVAGDANSFSGNLSSATVDLTKSGNGTLNLSGSNSYSGTTVVSSGTLHVTSLGFAGTGSTAGAGSAITLGAGSTAPTTYRLSGGGGTMNFTNGATHEWKMQPEHPVLTGGALASHDSTVTGSINSVRFEKTSGISATGTLTKVGGGGVVIAGRNDFTGGVTVDSSDAVSGPALAVDAARNDVDAASSIVANRGLLHPADPSAGHTIYSGGLVGAVQPSAPTPGVVGTGAISGQNSTGGGVVMNNGSGAITISGAATTGGDTVVAGGTGGLIMVNGASSAGGGTIVLSGSNGSNSTVNNYNLGSIAAAPGLQTKDNLLAYVADPAAVTERESRTREVALLFTDVEQQVGQPGYVVTMPGAPKLPAPESIIVTANPLPIVENPAAEAYARINDNPFKRVSDDALSTFSIDVDTASYANVRRFLTGGQLPPPDAVRIEEMINYFTYYYDQPEDGRPFAVHTEVADCPWAAGHKLVKIGLKGREMANDKRPPSNLVFLIDVSGSMNEPAKLPLLVSSMKLLTQQLTENDNISIVVYAGASGMVLPCTNGLNKEKITEALDRLSAGGSTAGAAGIRLAYQTAVDHFIKGGANRVILCTDGDFNVGITDPGQLTALIEQYRKTGVFLSVLGFGTGNLKDATMEQLADKGNGLYAYIDSLREGRKVLVEQMTGTLVTIAKDVKLQLEFNPAAVAGYRLIGYENRVMAHEDFNNDKKDAGDIGAGHTVTAIYEVVPVGGAAIQSGRANPPGVDELKYQKPEPLPVEKLTDAANRDELLTVKLRYKLPDSDTSTKIEYTVKTSERTFEQASPDFRFASSVASFGMILRHSPHRGTAGLDSVLRAAEQSVGDDKQGYRAEFVDLVRHAKTIAGR